MKVLLFLAGLVAGCLAADSLMDEWTNYKLQFSKQYQNPREELDRFALFSLAKTKVSQHNKLYDNGVVPYSLGINQWSDRTQEEIAELFHTMELPNVPASPARDVDLTGIPDSIDYRKKGAVTPVKDQGHCGSCWAFSTTGGLEGAHAMKHKKLVSLSEQQLVDCDYNATDPDHDNGCSGGNMYYAFQYIQETGGIDTETDYPYTSGRGVETHECKIKQNFAASVKAFSYTQTEKELEHYVGTVGPLSIGIHGDAFMHYSSGIFTDAYGKCKDNIDHGMLVVGYGTDDEKTKLPYFIVKNSWGTGWGEQGYLRILRGKGLCEIGKFNVPVEAV